MVKNINIMIMATRIRMKRGEKLEDILSHYLNLTDDDKQKIRDAVAV